MKKKSTLQSAPARRSLGEGGFFNLRVLIALFVMLAGVLLALLGFSTFSNASGQANIGSTSLAGLGQEPNTQQVGQTTVISAVHSDLSPPLREQPVEWPQAREKREPHVHPRIPFQHYERPDPVIQSSFSQALMVTPAIPAPIRQWAGMGEPCNGCSPGPPPDTNGAVGKTQYVEMVNEALQVFDKLTGTSLLGPIPIKSVWSGFGGVCQRAEDGDPIVVYDQLADRWLISQFATPSGAEVPQDECIAVSRTGDATGAWYRYHFHLSNRFQDYPKFGVWPDGYYMSSNIYGSPSRGEDQPPYLGPQPFVFDRAKMLVGDPAAKVQTRGLIGFKSEAPFLPSDLDGILPPPVDEPNHFVQSPVEVPEPPNATNLNEPPQGAQLTATGTSPATPASQPTLTYKIWDFHVDWIHPANSRFSRKASVPAADFALLCPEEPEDGACVPQRGTKNVLNNLPGQLMFRNAYRRFTDGRESMLNNFTVEAHSVAGIRWFELGRVSRGRWTLRQEKTYQPDNTWRWMASIASDNQGNITLGFSASSATIYPQIRYAGRLATDPLGILSGEKHLFDGTGSQVNPIDPHPWGDYSDMTVDPVDDCTFYYTNEYYQTTGGKLRTRIGYFRFAQCTPPQKGTARFIICDRGAPRSKTLVSIDGMTYGATLADGTYDAVLPPGSHRYAVSNPAFATQRGSFTIANGQTTLIKVCPARP